MEHLIEPDLLCRAVNVCVVGCGGTGSRVATALMELHTAMIARGHPGGLSVMFVDPDTVSAANVGRQAFFPSDIGQNKAKVLAQRASLCFNLRWGYSPARVTAESDFGAFDLVIGCVDSRGARRAILRAMERSRSGTRYWLDFGNRASDGQAILGHVLRDTRKTNGKNKLPHAAELFPEIIDDTADAADDAPSCSLTEALDKQDLFINRAVVDHGMNILWKLFRYGRISNHGVFVNIHTERVNPLPVDPTTWARFGYDQKTRIRTPRKSGKFKSSQREAAASA